MENNRHNRIWKTNWNYSTSYQILILIKQNGNLCYFESKIYKWSLLILLFSLFLIRLNLSSSCQRQSLGKSNGVNWGTKSGDRFSFDKQSKKKLSPLIPLVMEIFYYNCKHQDRIVFHSLGSECVLMHKV